MSQVTCQYLANNQRSLVVACIIPNSTNKYRKKMKYKFKTLRVSHLKMQFLPMHVLFPVCSTPGHRLRETGLFFFFFKEFFLHLNHFIILLLLLLFGHAVWYMGP